jgi:hypothetical protein
MDRYLRRRNETGFEGVLAGMRRIARDVALACARGIDPRRREHNF